MHFQILSHAGLLVRCAGKTLIFDPWLIGSTYWRSWWNYPPVSRNLVDGLKPDFLYLTHIHWDHFQGVSLRKFSPETPVYIPLDSNPRFRADLLALGFSDVREIPHGGSVDLAPGFRLTSWHFFPFTDSGAVVEGEGTVLFNANDAKFMGGPLKQILRRHPSIDFVFRSHSSANPRMCYDFMDAPERRLDAPDHYLRDFAGFAEAVGARFAIPFASNHCYLHRETFHFNAAVTTPAEVERYCRRRGLRSEVKVMVSGDSWSGQRGFLMGEEQPFADREEKLERYARDKAQVLERQYALEAQADISLSEVADNFRLFAEALPWALRLLYRGRPLAFLVTGRTTRRFVIDLFRAEAREVDALDDARHPLQIHTATHIFRQCIRKRLFTHLGISKRVLFRCRRADRKWLFFVELLLNMHEAGQLPWARMMHPRFFLGWARRWRELALYGRILWNSAMGIDFEMSDYLPPATRYARPRGLSSVVVGDFLADAAGPVDLLEKQHPGPFMGQGHSA